VIGWDYIWTLGWALFHAFLVIWAVGSAIVACFRPWRHFTGPDWWIAWLLVFLWWGIAAAMIVELAREHFDLARHDGDDSETGRGR